MCEELEKELARGQKAAEDLIEHLESTGADKIKIPITTDNGCYIIEIRRTL